MWKNKLNAYIYKQSKKKQFVSNLSFLGKLIEFYLSEWVLYKIYDIFIFFQEIFILYLVTLASIYRDFLHKNWECGLFLSTLENILLFEFVKLGVFFFYWFENKSIKIGMKIMLYSYLIDLTHITKSTCLLQIYILYDNYYMRNVSCENLELKMIICSK